MVRAPPMAYNEFHPPHCAGSQSPLILAARLGDHVLASILVNEAPSLNPNQTCVRTLSTTPSPSPRLTRMAELGLVSK